jgi:hypothetical protein
MTISESDESVKFNLGIVDQFWNALHGLAFPPGFCPVYFCGGLGLLDLFALSLLRLSQCPTLNTFRMDNLSQSLGLKFLFAVGATGPVESHTLASQHVMPMSPKSSTQTTSFKIGLLLTGCRMRSVALVMGL